MAFNSELRVQQVGDFDWCLLEPLIYKGHSDTFIIKKDFVTDFASSPVEFQWLIPRSGRYTKAAVLHDFLWRTGGEPKVTRSDADGIFRRAMAELNVPFLRRWVMWAGVRWGSLRKSWFRDGPSDIPRVLVITVAPGSLVIAGSLLVLPLLMSFLLCEYLTLLVLKALRKTSKGVTRRTKRLVKPKLSWRR